MAYVTPQLLVRQRFSPAAAAIATTRRAHITGPHAALFRHSVASEKATISLGEFIATADTTYSWPNRPTGSLIDLNYAKLYIDNAKLGYYVHTTGDGPAVVPVANRPNRIRSASVSFADNGADYPKSAVMGDRGAVVGDGVIVRGIVASELYELETTIRGFIGETVASTRGAATSGSGNATTQSFSQSIDLLGPKNNITLTALGSLYEGTPSGYISETYTITCTRASTGSDPTTALLQVRSASGTDDQDDVVPAAWGGNTEIGTRGLIIQFALNNTVSASSAAENESISPTNFSIGQSWRVTVNQAFTAPTATSGGTYTGTRDGTYIVEIVRGGTIGDVASPPTFKVSMTTGYDSASAVDVTAASTAIDVGNFDVTIAFAGAKLRARDKYYIEVTAESEGEYQTIVLADNLSDELQDATELDLTLYFKRDIILTEDREPSPPNANYAMTDAEITTYSGAEVYHADWTVDDEVATLYVLGGTLYAHYRAWLDTYTNTVDYANIDSVASLLGTVHPDNPLAYGVYMAALNAGDAEVAFTAVADPSSDTSWLAALAYLAGRSGIYMLAPLTDDPTVQAAWLAHANTESGESNKRWRRAVLAASVPTTKAIVSAATTSDGEPTLATLIDDVDASGTQYKVLVADSRAKFITKGVKGGDKVRYLYGLDAYGNESYSTFTVDTVVSESTLKFTTAHTEAVGVAEKFEVWRTLTRTDSPAEVIAQAGAFGDERAIMIANPTVEIDGVNQPGYFAAAAFAGLRSSVEANRPLTHVALNGLTGIGTLASQWNGPDKDSITSAGGLVIDRSDAGEIFIRHAVTTAGYNAGIKLFEEMYGSNVDSISVVFASVLEPYYGRANVVDSVLSAISDVMRNTAVGLSVTDATDIGPQVISFETPVVRQHETQKDKVVASIVLILPYPLNVLELSLDV